MVRRVGNAVKSVNNSHNKSLRFGISPSGIWKNSTSDRTGSATSGSEAYYKVYADARTWIQNEWIDYITPQIYWETGHAQADYETLVAWWSNEVQGTKVDLYIGQGVYKDAVATEITKQLQINAKYAAVKGSIYFSLRDLLNNRMQAQTQLTSYYGQVAGGSTSSGGSNVTTTVVDKSAVGKSGTVNVALLNVRAGARVDRDMGTQIASGTTVEIRDVLNEWYKIKLSNGTVGWVPAEFIKVGETVINTFPRTGTVTATTLNIRAGARVDRDLVAKVSYGTQVTLLSELGDWYKVRLANNLVGWCVKTYIK